MNKKRKWILIAGLIVILLVLLSVWMYYSAKTAAPTDNPISDATPAPTDISVAINTPEPTIPPAEPAVSENEDGANGEVQENVPIPTKPPAPKEKPKAEGDDTKAEAPPQYKKEDTVKESKKEAAKPKATQKPAEKPKTKATSKPAAPKENKDKVYVDGFGYVDVGGENHVDTADSDGDINKIVGTMD